MIYKFKTYNRPDSNSPFIQDLSGWTDDEIDAIRDYGDRLEKTPVKLYGKYYTNRVSVEGSHFPLNSETQWVYDKYASVIAKINDKSYNYDLNGLEENLYYHTYDGSQQHYFEWHYDAGTQTPAPRKLSLSLQLSDPKEYQGGVLQFMDLYEPLEAERIKGLTVAFPSYKAHRVTPVTAGIRRALVAFACGPNFR